MEENEFWLKIQSEETTQWIQETQIVKCQTANSLLHFAMEYHDLGWSIIPVHLRTKIPRMQWAPYQTCQATAEEIRQWFGGPDENSIGIVTGRCSNLTVLDCDGDDALALVQRLGLPATPSVKTAHGWHFYFRYKDGSRNFQKRADLPGIDLRSEGGYVVAPPSIHESGHEYVWLDNQSDFAELPDWVLADRSRPEQRPPAVHCYRPTGEGQRNDTLARLAGVWVHLGLDHALAVAGMWNVTMCRPPLPWQEVEMTVRSIAVAEQRTAAQAFQTVEPFYQGVQL
jgi:hypothetical protein